MDKSSSWSSASSSPPTSSSSSSPAEVDNRPALERLLSPEERKRLNNVRIDSFMGALKGFAVGMVVGYAGYHAAHYIPQLKGKIHRNHMIPSILVTGACCSYLLAVIQGRNSLMLVGDIFKNGPRIEVRDDPNSLQAPRLSSYQTHVVNNQREVIHRSEESFHRRAEAIRTAKTQSFGNNDGFSDPYATKSFKEDSERRSF